MLLREDPCAEKFGEIGIDSNGRVLSFLKTQYIPGEVVQRLMFTGIAVFGGDVFKFMPGKGEIFSLTRHTLKSILEQQGSISSQIYSGFWSDIGTPERLETASKAYVEIFGTS